MPALCAQLHAVEIGTKAPAFSIKDTNGKQITLSDLKGAPVVLEWVSHSCPFVAKHYDSGNMQALQKKYTAKEVVWLSICSSAPGKPGHHSPEAFNKMTAEKGAAPSAIILDEDGKIGRAYGAKTTPHMFVIDGEGNLIYQGAIDSIRSANAKDVKKATNYVAQALDAALEGKPVTEAQTPAYGCSIKY